MVMSSRRLAWLVITACRSSDFVGPARMLIKTQVELSPGQLSSVPGEVVARAIPYSEGNVACCGRDRLLYYEWIEREGRSSQSAAPSFSSNAGDRKCHET